MQYIIKFVKLQLQFMVYLRESLKIIHTPRY